MVAWLDQAFWNRRSDSDGEDTLQTAGSMMNKDNEQHEIAWVLPSILQSRWHVELCGVECDLWHIMWDVCMRYVHAAFSPVGRCWSQNVVSCCHYVQFRRGRLPPPPRRGKLPPRAGSCPPAQGSWELPSRAGSCPPAQEAALPRGKLPSRVGSCPPA